MQEVNCCTNCEVEVDSNGRGGPAKKQLCQPFPTRILLRIRNLFSCIKTQRHQYTQDECEKLAIEARRLHITQSTETQIQA
jgi:hypothetical protein